MAVKVMVAPAISRAKHAKQATPEAPARAGASTPRPKRRRASVYDADGNEVFITLICLKCQKIRPLSQFGLRRMADGAIRNQPWCRSCRSAPSEKSAKPAKEAPDTVESLAPAESPTPAASTEAAGTAGRTGSVAAEVAAAPAAGRS
jgi:hypothetical protein